MDGGKLQKYYERDRSYSRDRLQKYYDSNKSYRRNRSPKYYKNNYEREYYNTFQDHGNRRNYKDDYKDKYRNENNSHGRDRAYDKNRSYSRDRDNSQEYKRDTLEIDHMTEMIHIVEIDHNTTVEMSIRRKIINIREGLEIIMKTPMGTGMVGINMNANSEMTDMT